MSTISISKLKDAIKKQSYEFSDTPNGIEISKYKSDYAYMMHEILSSGDYVIRLTTYGNKFKLGEKYRFNDVIYNDGEDNPPTDIEVFNTNGDVISGSILRFIPASWIKNYKSNLPEWL